MSVLWTWGVNKQPVSVLTKAKILWLVHFLVELPNTISCKNTKMFHHSSGLIAKTVALGVQKAASLELHEFPLIVLNTLHFRVNNTESVSQRTIPRRG